MVKIQCNAIITVHCYDVSLYLHFAANKLNNYSYCNVYKYE